MKHPGENGMSVKYLLDPKNVHTETTMISVICIEEYAMKF